MVGRIFLGRYEVIRLLGEGGMGRVYLARQADLGRQVVVKVMHDHVASDPKFIERFQRETLLMARFQHPYAVTLYDASLTDPQGPCIVMEYIKGISLDALLERNGRFTPTRVGRLLGQLCEVLYAAHGQGIIHRDLKPANLMVIDHDTPYEKIKVMDFGLAKMIDAGSLKKNNVTGTDFAVGTPGYISPEQIRGEDSDHRSDLYSVGVILYELLTGHLPFKGRSTMEVLLAHATEPPPPFAEIGAGAWVPAAVEDVVRRCLAKDRAERPASARDLAEEYETALAHEESVLETALPPNHPRSPERATAPLPPVKVIDPCVVVNELEAWMPEAIASYKLRGFVHDKGGEVLESQPGMIRVRLGGPGSSYASGGGALAWLGLSSRGGPIEMELRMERAHGDRDSVLRLTVLMRDEKRRGAIDDSTRARCTQIFCDLRGYLMANGTVKS